MARALDVGIGVGSGGTLHFEGDAEFSSTGALAALVVVGPAGLSGFWVSWISRGIGREEAAPRLVRWARVSRVQGCGHGYVDGTG